VLAGYRLVTFRLPQKLPKHAKRVHSGPFFMLVCKVDPQKTVPVGLKEDGAHCWIRTGKVPLHPSKVALFRENSKSQ